jgi:hypothetical protein
MVLCNTNPDSVQKCYRCKGYFPNHNLFAIKDWLPNRQRGACCAKCAKAYADMYPLSPGAKRLARTGNVA